MRVTKHFKLGVASADVSFVDVDVLTDNRLFVDPSAIRVEAARGNKWAKKANDSLVSFFDRVLVSLGDARLHKQGEDALAEFHEPPETCLGMSKAGVNGSGASREIGERIWRSLLSNPICGARVALLKRVEDIALFVEDISNDRVSDLSTRIIMQDLIEYTHTQMVKYPDLALNPIQVEIQVWDFVNYDWTTANVQLPRIVSAGRIDKALLLVPKRLVHIGLRMNPIGFWGIEAIGAVQADETKEIVISPKKVKYDKPNKDDLKKRPELAKVRPTNTEQTLRIWDRDGRSLVESYRKYIDRSYEAVSEEKLNEKTTPR